MDLVISDLFELYGADPSRGQKPGLVISNILLFLYYFTHPRSRRYFSKPFCDPLSAHEPFFPMGKAKAWPWSFHRTHQTGSHIQTAFGGFSRSLIKIKAGALLKLYAGAQLAFSHPKPTPPHWPNRPHEAGYKHLFNFDFGLKSCLSAQIMCKHSFTNSHGRNGNKEIDFG